MRLNWADFRRKCQFPLLLATGTLPIPMLVCALAVSEGVRAALAMMALYVVLAWACLLIRGKLRLAAGALGAAMLIAVGAASLPIGEAHAALLIPTLYAVLLLSGLQFAGWGRGRELNPVVCALLVVAHVIAQILVNVAAGGDSPYAAVDELLIAGFICFGALMLLYLNRVSLNLAVNGKQAVPASMRRKNKLMTFALLGVTLLIAALPAVARAAERAWQWFKMLLIAVIQWLLSLFPGDSVAGTESGGSGGGFPAMEASEPSTLAVILEKIMAVVVLTAVAVLAVFALRILWRKIRVLLRRLWAQLNAYLASSTEDYEDEIADTREDGAAERSVRRSRRRTPRRRVNEGALKPAERIRYRYLMAWLRHPEWTPERTARENLSEGAAQLYERARYSDHEVSPQEAEEFAKMMQER
ncbi:MAG: hypothetical protein ACI4MF_04635 [Candidatus Faecivicinus sp.]